MRGVEIGEVRVKVAGGVRLERVVVFMGMGGGILGICVFWFGLGVGEGFFISSRGGACVFFLFLVCGSCFFSRCGYRYVFFFFSIWRGCGLFSSRVCVCFLRG